MFYAKPSYYLKVEPPNVMLARSQKPTSRRFGCWEFVDNILRPTDNTSLDRDPADTPLVLLPAELRVSQLGSAKQSTTNGSSMLKTIAKPTH